MAKADDKRNAAAPAVSEDWVLLAEARHLVVDAVKAPALAERLIVERLESGKMRWRCWRAETTDKITGPGIGDPAYWREYDDSIPERPGGAVQRVRRLFIEWSESHARRQLGPILVSRVYRVEVPRADVMAMLTDAGLHAVAADPKKTSGRRDFQAERVRRVLQTVCPNGTDGISTAEIERRIADALKDESIQLGIKNPSRPVIGRVLGRRN